MPDESESRALTSGMSDVFGVKTSNVLKNVLDIGAHYPINPERLRLFVDGTRQFPQYGSVSQYNHAGPHHELKPAQGETVTMETAEKPRYAVGFEQLYSFAFGLSRGLESGDRIRVGPFDDNNGWYIEQRGSDHSESEVDLFVRAGGTDKKAGPGQFLLLPARKFTRVELRTAWYRVTRQLWRESVARGGIQQTKTIGRTSVEDGPEVGNLPLRFQVTRDASSSSLTFEAGSCALITQGDKTTIRRNKTHEVEFNTDASASGTNWRPRYAMRIDPSRSIVDTQFAQVRVMAYGGTNDVVCALQAHDPTKVQETSDNTQLDDADFSTPDEHNAQNSVLQETDPTSKNLEAADSDGNLQTSTTTPGGYQVGYSSLYASGEGSKTTTARSDLLRKRGLYGGDIAVLWVRADDSGVNLTVEIVTEQDW